MPDTLILHDNFYHDSYGDIEVEYESKYIDDWVPYGDSRVCMTINQITIIGATIDGDWFDEKDIDPNLLDWIERKI